MTRGAGSYSRYSRRRTLSRADSSAARVTGVAERSMAMSRGSTSAAPPDFEWDMVDRRLETWDDPTPRESLFTLDELREACVAAAERHASRTTMSPTREERIKCRDEHDRNSLTIALQAYAKKNNMQSIDFELVEIKQRNLIDEHGKGFLHFNFVVKERDDKLTTFFAELHPNLKDESDVYLCMPLEDKENQAYCYGCKDRAKDLIHPSDGSFVGGHKHVEFPFMEFDSDDGDD